MPMERSTMPMPSSRIPDARLPWLRIHRIVASANHFFPLPPLRMRVFSPAFRRISFPFQAFLEPSDEVSSTHLRGLSH